MPGNGAEMHLPDFAPARTRTVARSDRGILAGVVVDAVLAQFGDRVELARFLVLLEVENALVVQIVLEGIGLGVVRRLQALVVRLVDLQLRIDRQRIAGGPIADRLRDRDGAGALD
jgi:hypothetical protein